MVSSLRGLYGSSGGGSPAMEIGAEGDAGHLFQLFSFQGTDSLPMAEEQTGNSFQFIAPASCYGSNQIITESLAWQRKKTVSRTGGVPGKGP